MFESGLTCVLLLLTILPGLPSGATRTISKYVCLGDSLQLFQNISLTTRKLVIYQVRGGASREIATWSMQGFVLQSFVDQRYKGLVYLDEYGTIWMRKIDNSNEGKYSLVSTEHTGSTCTLDVEIIVMEAPRMDCKPQIKRMDTYLLAVLDANVCGRPAASKYWSRYKDQTVVQLLPGKEAGAYHACIESPSLICARGSKATDFCSSFRIEADEEVIPKISQVQGSIEDSSIVLFCQSRDKSTGRFSWRQNGNPINNNAKYYQTDDSLTIRYLKTDDQYRIYTCMESGSRFESYPYSIETSGPTFIKVSPKKLVVKEHDSLNVSCLSDCYPLCSLHWFKSDRSDDVNTIVSEANILQLMDVTRVMSGNYSCKVRNIITGVFSESSLSLDVLYGPDDIVFNSSNNIIEMAKFDSITILATAECFPPCLFRWTETYTEAVTIGADLKIVNVKMDSTYTCHAMNPKRDKATISETIMIKVNFGTDTALVPRIELVKYNATDSSVVLQCVSSRVPTTRFSWRVNGSVITNLGRYTEDNLFLFVRHLTAEDPNNSVTCIDSGSGFQSDPFWIKTRGPDEVVLNTSNSISEVYQFSSITVFCSADCFPTCLYSWTFSNADTIQEGAKLKVANVTSNVSLKCHARNPININVTASGTIDIMVKSRNGQDLRINFWDTDDTTSSSNQGRAIETTSTRDLIYITPGIACVGILACFAVCFRKKSIISRSVDGVSNNNQGTNTNINTGDERLQVETLSEHYWTIVTNASEEPSTALERNINIELGDITNLVYLDQIKTNKSVNKSHQTSDEEVACTLPFKPDPFEIFKNYSGQEEHNGYISPIHADPTRQSEYTDHIHANPVECNAYIHPDHSDNVIHEAYIHPIHYDSNELTRPVHLVLSDPGILSGPGKSDAYTDQLDSYSIERDGYIEVIPSDNMKSDIYIDNIPLD